MICPKCGSANVAVQMVTDTRLRAGHGPVWWILIGWWWLPIKWFCFFWLALIFKLFGSKTYKLQSNTHAVCVCQACGYHWSAEDAAQPQAPRAAASAPQMPATSARPVGRELKSCEVAGESHYKDNIASLGVIRREYYWPTDRLYEKFVDGDVIFKYHFDALSAELVPEPDNPHDPNAIRVDVGGETVGYIPREQTAGIHALIEGGATARAIIGAGPRKIIFEDESGQLAAKKEDYDFSVSLQLREPAVQSPQPSARAATAPDGETETRGGILPRVLFWLFALLCALGACGVFVVGLSADMPAAYLGACVAATLVCGAVAYALTDKALA